MSWTDHSILVRVSVMVHDDAPPGLWERVDEMINEATVVLRDKVNAAQLPDDLITVEVW